MSTREWIEHIVGQISLPESLGEKTAQARWIIEHLTGSFPVQPSSEVSLSGERVNDIVHQLNTGAPLQYILGEAFFYSRRFEVNPSVLIPRPETELLVDEVLSKTANGDTVIDLCTGSGCIATTLALQNTTLRVTATDISQTALDIARRNASTLKAEVQFIQHDLLHASYPFSSNIIVSNPPYIPERERLTLSVQIREHEPAIALFVPDNDPLIFYRRLVTLSESAIKPSGWLITEVHQSYAAEVANLFTSSGLVHVTVRKDYSSNDRIVLAQRP